MYSFASMSKIQIDGNEIEVPDAVANHLKAQEERLAKIEADSKANAEAMAKAKAEADAKASAEEQARRKAEVDGHLKKGEFDKAIELERSQTRALSERFRDSELRAMVAANPNLRDDIRDGIVADAVELLRSRAEFDFHSGKLVIKENGNPVADAKAYVDSWIAARPAWIKPAANTGSGADRTRTGSGAGSALKRSAMTVEEKAAYAAQHGTEAYLALPA